MRLTRAEKDFLDGWAKVLLIVGLIALIWWLS